MLKITKWVMYKSGDISPMISKKSNEDIEYMKKFYITLGYLEMGEYDVFKILMHKPIDWDTTEFLGLQEV